MHAEITVTGIVQGVGFRPFIYRIAIANSLTGYVQNRGDAGVKIVAEGTEQNITQFVKDLENKRPPLAEIYDINIKYSKKNQDFETFTILKSSHTVELSGSVIPPDVSICDECLRELRTPKNERYDYFFITCTDCGPRYTIINTLPYDRPTTTMKAFPMCGFCRREYTDPLNRRFHAQTVACTKCGPKAYLVDNAGKPVVRGDPIREAGKLLEDGFIIGVKGNGGFHIATSTTQSDPILKLRRVKERAQKPFAIMARSLATVKSFADVSEAEEKLLTSYVKPIVLLNKSDEYYLSEEVAPHLHNIGVMLPYTGLHVMLFDEVKEPAFVMTSANPPDEPIITENKQAIGKLGSVVDYFLLHNRDIAQRCDDSVVRFHARSKVIIRRSRGYAPAPIRLKRAVKRCALGVGAELMATSCVVLHDKAFLSQHVGDVEKLETLEFLRETVNHMLRLTNSKVNIIGRDLHPEFNTTRLAHDLAEQLECSVIPVQHHHAHITSLMSESNIQEMIGIACDGFGYGSDGNAWGGEILHCGEWGFERLGHLQEQPMVGGDLATRNPLRMVAGILKDVPNIGDWLLARSKFFPHGQREVEVVLKQLHNPSSLKTTSCGRVLDAISALLGISYQRSYEGEPAIKMESSAMKGREVLNLRPNLDGATLNTTNLVEEIFRLQDKHSVADLAHSAQAYLAKGLAQLAIEAAEQQGVRNIGFSGGVGYNEHITQTIRKTVKANGFKLLVHNDIPPGDGGISFGQAIVAAFSREQR